MQRKPFAALLLLTQENKSHIYMSRRNMASHQRDSQSRTLVGIKSSSYIDTIIRAHPKNLLKIGEHQPVLGPSGLPSDRPACRRTPSLDVLRLACRRTCIILPSLIKALSVLQLSEGVLLSSSARCCFQSNHDVVQWFPKWRAQSHCRGAQYDFYKKTLLV